MLEDREDTINEKFTYTGKIIDIKDTNENEIVVNILNSKKTIKIKLTDNNTFDENISNDFILGNLIIFETTNCLTVNEDDTVELDITRIIANEKDEIITVDKREAISSSIGIFPNVILEEEKQITVKKDKIIAIAVPKVDECSWEHIIDNENIRLINESYEKDISDNEEEHYLAFVADNSGDSELILQLTKDDEIIKELVYKIYIN